MFDAVAGRDPRGRRLRRDPAGQDAAASSRRSPTRPRRARTFRRSGSARSPKAARTSTPRRSPTSRASSRPLGGDPPGRRRARRLPPGQPAARPRRHRRAAAVVLRERRRAPAARARRRAPARRSSPATKSSRTCSASRSPWSKDGCDGALARRRRSDDAALAGASAVGGDCRGAACRADGGDGPLRASGYVEATEVRVAPEVGGRVLELAVEEGDRVAAARSIARLDTTDTELAIRRAEADRDQAVAQLRLLQAGARAEDVRQARAQAESAQADVAAAESELRVRGEPTSRGSRRCWRRTPARASSATMRRRGGTWRRRASAPRAGRERAAPPKGLRGLRAGARPEEIAAARARVAPSTRRSPRSRRARAMPSLKSPVRRHRHVEAGRRRRIDRAAARRSSSSPISIARGPTSTSTSRSCRG